MSRGERGRRAGRGPVWMAAVLLAAGCGGGEKEGSAPLAHLNRGAAKAAELDSAPPPPPLVGASVDTVRGADSLWGVPPSGPAPADTAPAAADTVPPAPAQAEGDRGQWTAGVVEKRSSGRGGTLVEVRTARNRSWDRVVFVFQGEHPGYRVEYVDRPVRQCGSGNAVALAGDAWLSVQLTPARAHDDAGQVTVRERSLAPGLPVLKELKLTCDFEADVTWVLGVARPNRFRVLELRQPTRLVVDVRH